MHPDQGNHEADIGCFIILVEKLQKCYIEHWSTLQCSAMSLAMEAFFWHPRLSELGLFEDATKYVCRS